MNALEAFPLSFWIWIYKYAHSFPSSRLQIKKSIWKSKLVLLFSFLCSVRNRCVTGAPLSARAHIRQLVESTWDRCFPRERAVQSAAVSALLSCSTSTGLVTSTRLVIRVQVRLSVTKSRIGAWCEYSVSYVSSRLCATSFCQVCQLWHKPLPANTFEINLISCLGTNL